MVLSKIFLLSMLFEVIVGFLDVDSEFKSRHHNECVLEPKNFTTNPGNLTCEPTPSSCTKSRYRSFDGSCNNLQHPNWGAAMTPYARLTKPHFADGLHEMPRSVSGCPLPNARELSFKIFLDKLVESDIMNLNAAQWGQIITHDMSFTAGISVTTAPDPCCNQGQLTPLAYNTSSCAPILVPPKDPVYSTAGKQCIFFERTTTSRDVGCTPANATAEPLTAVTAFMDLSIVYGNNASQAASLRTNTGGRMLTLVRNGQEWPPQQPSPSTYCRVESPDEPCYLAGDIRVNQNTHLTVLQVILLREHNRVANKLADLNPHWDDETIYQEARRIHIAQIQHIHYYEYLPNFLGCKNMVAKKLNYLGASGYINDYNPNVNPSILNEHATAAFRHFHTLLRGHLKLLFENRQLDETVRLSDWMTKPLLLELNNNFEKLTRGTTFQTMSLSDQFWTAEVRDYIFRPTNGTVGEDLRAFDIERGRDHGLGPYVAARAACGLTVPSTFHDMHAYISVKNVAILKRMYASPQDVDLVVAGSLERHVSGAMVGPTFFCILMKQFYRTRVGDRYFYENGADPDIAFTMNQLNAIRKGANVARLLCDNANNVDHMQRKAFRQVSDNNSRQRRASGSRSRSVTPQREDGRHGQPSARRSIMLGLLENVPDRDPGVSSSPPRKIRAMNAECTPRGSIHITGEETVVFRTPGGNIRRSMTACDNAQERAEAMGIPDADLEELFQEHPQHIARWLPELEYPSQASIIGNTVASVMDPSDGENRPSTSEVANNRPSIVYDYESDGSGFDSDWDDAFETSPIEATTNTHVRRDIPADEELEAPVRDMVNQVARGIDDEADRLLGRSTSFVWREDFESFRGVPEQFSGPTPGPLKNYISAYDAFVDIWDKNIIDQIVCETNRYAQQTIEGLKAKGTLTQSSRLRRWVPTNADEMMVLFAIIQFMGIDPRQSLDEYWDKGYLGMPAFRSLMSYNRYILLNKFLHFVDNTKLDSFVMPQSGAMGSTKVLSRRLFKLSPIIEHLGKKFDSLYQLRPHLAIDESLTLFKGRLSWVQTIRSKAARFGIKSYELCESETGYMARFQIYTGKDDVSTELQSCANLGLKSATVVLELLQGLENRGHCVTMDNFYNCPSLARYLKSLGFDCFGTLRTNRRYVPDEIAKVPANVPKGTIISRHSGDVSIVSWKDAKMVTIISTFHNAGTYVGSRAGKPCVKPVSVRDYNSYMGGVDVKDQKLSMYLLERKRGLKWYVKMFKRLMNVSIMNSFIMYTSCQQRRGQLPGTHREFRYALAESLIEKHRVTQLKIQQPVAELTRLNRDIVHNPQYLPGRDNRRRCRVCYVRSKHTKYVHFKCVPCDVFLCLEGCWVAWHTEPDLKA